MALTLLMAIQSHPEASPALRAQAISVANSAIATAIEEQATVAPAPIVATTTSNFYTDSNYKGYITGPNYYNKNDGCIYAAPKGATGGGIKVSCGAGIKPEYMK